MHASVLRAANGVGEEEGAQQDENVQPGRGCSRWGRMDTWIRESQEAKTILVQLCLHLLCPIQPLPAKQLPWILFVTNTSSKAFPAV